MAEALFNQPIPCLTLAMWRRSKALTQNDFVKMLIAQMKAQKPLNPHNNTKQVLSISASSSNR